MKKRFLVMAMAGLALVGCVSEDVSDVKQKDEKVKIAFESPVMYNSTESRIIYGEMANPYDKGESFVVYGVEHSNNFSSWSSATPFMDKEVVEYDTDLNGWKPTSKDYFWPYDKRCTFAAYSPSGASGTFNYGTGGLTITGFTVDEDLSEQYDLMFSKREYNRTTSNHTTGTYNGVPLTFQHALSSIHFALVSSHTQQVTLKSIKLTGLYNKADFKEQVVEQATYLADPEWDNFDGEVGYTIYNDETSDTSDDVLFPGDMKRLSALLPSGTPHHGLLTIPQSLDNVKLLVSYTIDGEQPVEDKPIDLSSYFSNKWEMGTRYYYVLAIGSASSKIYFAPIVETWNTDDTIIQLQ